MKTKTIKTAKNCYAEPGVRMTYLKKAASEYLFNHRDGGCSLIVVRAYNTTDGNKLEFSCNTHPFGKVVGEGVVSSRFQTEQGDIAARFDGRILTISHPVEWKK